MATKHFLELPGDVKMPILGLGTFRMTDESEVITALNTALEAGYRHIDTAFLYQNEKTIGKVLKEWFNSGKLKREDIFITTKLPMFGVHPDRVEFYMKKSLQDLQLDYVDLYLIHFPVGIKWDVNNPGMPDFQKMEAEGKTDHAAVWKKMEEQVEAGRAKTIGLSNYSIPQMETVLKSAKIKPANLQIELHVFLQQRKVVDFCHKNGITVVAYCPLGAPGTNEFYKKIGHPPRDLPDILGNPVIAKIAKKHSKTPAQVALRFLLQLGISAVPKSKTPSRIRENINVFDFSLDDQDFQELLNLEAGESARIVKFNSLKAVAGHPDCPVYT